MFESLGVRKNTYQHVGLGKGGKVHANIMN